MIIGISDAWVKHFKRHDERLLERICAILPDCIAVLGNNPHEDAITLNLVTRFHKDKIIRRLFHYWEYQFEPHGIDIHGAAYSKGQIDFALFWDTDREQYLAYEAKRLNVSTQKGTASLATPYIKQGVLRFVTEQYSKDLPVGCMLGYVLDGNITSIYPKVTKAIKENAKLIGLLLPSKPLPMISTAKRFESTHEREQSGGYINIRHALVPCC